MATHDNFITPSQLKPKSLLLKDDGDDDVNDTLIVCDGTSVKTNYTVNKPKHAHYDHSSPYYKKVKELEEIDKEDYTKVWNILNRYINKINKLTTALRKKNEQLLENQNKEN